MNVEDAYNEMWNGDEMEKRIYYCAALMVAPTRPHRQPFQFHYERGRLMT
jgi:hypothetical protein